MDVKVILTFNVQDLKSSVSIQQLFEFWAFDQLGVTIEVQDNNTGDVVGEFILSHDDWNVETWTQEPDDQEID